MIFVLIFIALTFSIIAAFQFMYVFYLQRIEIEHKTKIRELERHCKNLTEKLHTAETRLAEYEADYGNEDEIWADVIGEH